MNIATSHHIASAATTRRNATAQAEAAPLELKYEDVVYIRKDAVEDKPFMTAKDFGKFVKVGSVAAIGGVLGAVPLVGAASNFMSMAEAGHHRDTNAGLIGIGGAVANLVACAAAGNGYPLALIAPALCGAVAWGSAAAHNSK